MNKSEWEDYAKSEVRIVKSLQRWIDGWIDGWIDEG
jgi:hypothetical protein